MKQNLQLVGTTRIFAKEMDGKTVYSTSISNRNLDGTYEKNVHYSAISQRHSNREPNRHNNTRKFYEFL